MIAYVAPFATYIVYRNQRWTTIGGCSPGSISASGWPRRLDKMGMKMAAEKRDPHESGRAGEAPGQRRSRRATDNARLLLARQSPGWRTAREILAEGSGRPRLRPSCSITRSRAWPCGRWSTACGFRRGGQAARTGRPRPGIAQAALRPESPGPPEPAGRAPSSPSTSRSATRPRSPRREPPAANGC